MTDTCNHGRRDSHIHLHDGHDAEGEDDAQGKPGSASENSDDDRLDKKLHENLPARCTEGLANTDFPHALGE